jgi:hypothetical protein
MISDDRDASVQPQNTLCLPQFRLKLFRRRHIPSNLGFCGHPPAWVLHGGRAEPSHTRIRSGAHRLRRNLLHLHLPTPNAPSKVKHLSFFQDVLLRSQYKILLVLILPSMRPYLTLAFLEVDQKTHTHHDN